MLSVHASTIRLFLHVLAATIWVGGQLTLGALVPTLRAAGADVPRRAAQQFGRVAWTAYVVLLGTGAWNVVAESDHVHGAYQTTLEVKIAVVLASGLAAFLHARARSRAGLAVFGALAALTALGALFVGVLLSEV